MNKVFLDTDVILDLLWNREPFSEKIEIIFEEAKQNNLILSASAVSFTTVFYFLKKYSNTENAKKLVKSLLEIVNVLSVNENIIKRAINFGFPDFEDAVQYFTAIENEQSIILTRNVSDFKLKDIPAITPEDYLKIGPIRN
ncbi:MAG: PIN domain-containing protein [Ignavibacteriae bacterium]|nr:MAG: PIN domain-containing protein [Ignavibacteriota bacterium]